MGVTFNSRGITYQIAKTRIGRHAAMNSWKDWVPTIVWVLAAVWAGNVINRWVDEILEALHDIRDELRVLRGATSKE